MTNTPKLHIEIRAVYGKVRIYPKCAFTTALLAIKNQKSFDKIDIIHLERIASLVGAEVEQANSLNGITRDRFITELESLRTLSPPPT